MVSSSSSLTEAVERLIDALGEVPRQVHGGVSMPHIVPYVQ